MMRPVTFGSLFAGIGGFDLGFERAGLACRWQVEIDPDCRAVLGRRWPGIPRREDVRDCGPHDLARVDVICFGSPCQDLSTAGRRAGLEGERSGLFFEAVRIIRCIRPAVVVWENVPGLLSSDGGRDFGRALDALADCGALDIGWRVLDAQWFGVAQRRRRVFVVADLRGRRAAEILALADSLSGYPAPRRQAGQGIARPIASCAHGGSGWRNDADTADNLIPFQATGDGYWRAGLGPLADSDDNGCNQVIAFTIIASAGHHGHSSPRGDGADNLVVGPIPLHYSHDYNQDRVYDPSGPTPALTARDSNRTRSFLTGMVVRRLMPIECERLMGLPDDWTAGHADSNRYRMLGNAVVVPVSVWLGRRIVAALKRNGSGPLKMATEPEDEPEEILA